MSPPAILCPPWQGDSPKPLSFQVHSHDHHLAQVTRNTSGTWLLGLGWVFSACLWQWWTLKALFLPVMLKTPNNPSCWLLLFGPSSPAEQQNSCFGKGEGKSAAEETEQKKLSLYRLTNTNKQSLSYELGKMFFTPSSLVYRWMRAHWEQFWKKTKLVYPSEKWERGQNRGQIAALPLLALQQCVSLCNVNVIVIF